MVVVVRTGGRRISLNIYADSAVTLLYCQKMSKRYNISVLLIYEETDANKYFYTIFLAFIHVLYLYHSVNPIVADV